MAVRLDKLVNFVASRGWRYHYAEPGGLGALSFEYKGLRYRAWEFDEGEPGAESNVRSTGRSDDYYGDYEEQILAILRTWD